MWKSVLLIFLGGGFGSVIRFLISNYTQKLFTIKDFPAGTFTVNMIGCFIIGCASAYFINVDNSLKFLIITGFCGGFTTFSAFSVENYALFQSGNYGTLSIYIILSIILGIVAVWSGFIIFKN